MPRRPWRGEQAQLTLEYTRSISGPMLQTDIAGTDRQFLTNLIAHAELIYSAVD